MLPPFIIEQIRKREEDERARHQQPVLELPIPMGPAHRSPRPREAEEEPSRGVIILEL
jgi:hypothetical protein